MLTAHLSLLQPVDKSNVEKRVHNSNRAGSVTNSSFFIYQSMSISHFSWWIPGKTKIASKWHKTVCGGLIFDMWGIIPVKIAPMQVPIPLHSGE